MQIDVNSVADRVQLIRTQLTAAKGPQFNPKTVVDNTGSELTSKASSGVEKNPGILTTRSISSVVPPGPKVPFTIQPDVAANKHQTPVPTPKPASRLDALLADWGKTDSPYDLDGNGIVGASDLLLLLAKLGGGSQQPQDPHGDVADTQRPSVTSDDHPLVSDPSSPDNEPANRLEALLADWGTTDSPYDLDGNGIVGASDLLMLLAQMGGGGAQQPQDPHGDVADRRRTSSQAPVEIPAPPNMPYSSSPITPSPSVAIGVKTTAIAQDVIDKLDQDKNGTISTSEVNGSTQAFDRLDRNQDGALSRSELASQIRNMLLDHLAKNPNANLHQFVQEAMKLLSDRDEDNEAPSKLNPAVERSSSVYRQANLKATARQLVQGLTDQGAMELRKFVQAGELSANEKRTVLDQISHLRPGAQRVNLVG